jgi:small GTP-binding protein
LKTLESEITRTRIIRKKVCLLGDFAVGKTSLVRRYVHGLFDEKYLTTIGVTLSQKSLFRKEHELRLIVWDLAGGEDFSRPETLYLRGTAGALIICDLTRADSLPSVEHYARQLWQGSAGADIVLVGNKSDLARDRHTQTMHSDLAAMAAKLNTQYVLTSAKTGENVELAFELLADLIESR